MNKIKLLKQSLAYILIIICVISNLTIVEASETNKTLTMNKTNITLYTGQSVQLKIKNNSQKYKVSWSSSQKKVATVNNKGKVVAKKSGNTTIKAKVNNKTLKCKIIVKNPSLNTKNKKLELGEKFTLKLNGRTVKSFKSSNNKIVSVNKNGVVSSKKVGTATITVTDKNNKKYKCKVNVIHNHKYEIINTQVATCEQNGYIEYKCSCGDTYKEIINSTGHNYENIKIVKEASCTSKGELQSICNKCNNIKTIYLDVKEHSYDMGIIIKDSTCDEFGEKKYTCKECGNTHYETLQKKEHIISLLNKIEPTCVSQGSITTQCSLCHKTWTEEIPKISHNYKETIIKSTCEEKGYTLHTCTMCNDSYKDNYKEYDNHCFDSGIITTQPTCTKEGVKTYTCTVCGKTKTESIKNLGHNYVDKIVTSTCLNQGYTLHTCERCNDSYKSDYTDKSACKYNSGVITTQPTCTKEGVKTYTCTVCGKTKTESIKSLGHNYIKSIVEPSANYAGYDTYTCSICDDTYKSYDNSYTESYFPTAFSNWNYTIYEDKYIINLDSYKDINVTSISVPGVAFIGGKTYNVTIGYEKDDAYDVFSNVRDTVTDIKIECPLKIYNGKGLFSNIVKLKNIKFQNAIYCNDKTSFEYMFKNCMYLETVDFSNIYMDNVQSLYGTFENCINLKSVTFPKSGSSKNLVNLGNTFWGCQNLTNVNFNNFEISVMCMGGIFGNCNSITELNLNNLKGTSSTFISSFYNCKSLQYVYMQNMEADSNTYFKSMFYNCSSLKGVYINSTLKQYLNKNIGISYLDASKIICN